MISTYMLLQEGERPKAVTWEKAGCGTESSFWKFSLHMPFAVFAKITQVIPLQHLSLVSAMSFLIVTNYSN